MIMHDGMLVLVMKVVFILTYYPGTTCRHVVEELKTFYRI